MPWYCSWPGAKGWMWAVLKGREELPAQWLGSWHCRQDPAAPGVPLLPQGGDRAISAHPRGTVHLSVCTNRAPQHGAELVCLRQFTPRVPWQGLQHC